MKKKQKGSSNFGAKGWFIVIISFFYFYLLNTVAVDGLNTILPIFVEKFACDRSQLAIFGTIGGWLSLLSFPIFTFFSKRKGTKQTICGCLLISAITIYFLFNAVNIPMFGIALIVHRMAINGVGIVGTGELGANWFPTKKGLFMGWATFGVVGSAATTNLIMSGLISNIGIGQSCWFYIGVTVAVLVVTALFVKNNPEEAGAFPDNDTSMTKEKAREIYERGEELKKSSPWTVQKVLGYKQTWFIALGWGLLVMGASGIMSQFVMAGLEFGHDITFPIMLLTAMSPIGLFFSWFIGWIDDKFSTKTASIVVSCMLIFGTVIAGLFGANPIAFAVGGGCFMSALSGGNNLTMSITSTKFGRYDFANAFSIISLLSQVIAATGIVFVSFIADQFSYRASYLCVAATVVLAAIFIILTDATCVGRTAVDAEKETQDK